MRVIERPVRIRALSIVRARGTRMGRFRPEVVRVHSPAPILFSHSLSLSATLAFFPFPVYSRTYENLFSLGRSDDVNGLFFSSAYKDGNSYVGSRRIVGDQGLRLRWE